ncbi:MAG: ATP-binding protein, partial [Blastocatellia bacterium]|nr:ATP-binding protein [Blastocatellia bacterium]
ASQNSDVARAARVTLRTASYHLGPHCDGCPYNALCFIDTAERGDLSLVPLLSASEKSALFSEGIRTAQDLAGLMDYGKGKMVPATGQESTVERIASRWPLGGSLPVLVQRARRALKKEDFFPQRHDPATSARSYIVGSDYGTLPDPEQYPDLIKVFVDAQRDHIEDRLYLIAGLVVGPRASVEVLEMTDGPPDTESEREMLVAWMQQLLPAVARVSDLEHAPVHVYLYDRRSQRALLDGLARHFDALCAIPAFYDLLTSSPALTQGMISFLAEEVRARSNLPAISQNLYQVAREMGFKWRHGSSDFVKMFHARVFDNLRRFDRDPQSGRFITPKDAEGGARPGSAPLWVESAARFGTEIPLEYAYAAWGAFKEMPEIQYPDREGGDKARDHLRSFSGVAPEDIRALAAHRCRALRHIEENFKYKNKRIEKQPLKLDHLDKIEIDPEDVPLHRSLEDFLFLEHHATFQERLLHFSLPPELRMQTGRTAILRCDDNEKLESGGERPRFHFADAEGAPITISDIGTLKFREGDWTVLNPLEDERGGQIPAWLVVRGRLAVVEEIGDESVLLRLLPMSFKNSEFRYKHRFFNPEPGALYTLDEMADDLNADKFLEACRHASSNHLYRWLSDTEEGKRPRQIRPKRLREGETAAELAARSQAPLRLTVAQRRIVGQHFEDRILVVQGPPGTGKSHTLGFAILSRALALATPARPFRVAVAAKTHAATMIALESIARRAKELLGAFPDEARLAPLASMKLVKVSSGVADSVPDGIDLIYADGGEGLSAAEQWAMLLEARLLIIGSTPGGLYNLVKRGASKGRAIDWSQEIFDLVVVDEASQMGIAEAMAAAAFLREDGQFIAIGDHRQMPPILSYAWDQDSRRELKHRRPHLSIFESLRELGFASAALDQSFRIPAEIAEFLERHVYAEDGIHFRSDNRKRMSDSSELKGWTAAALAPSHPLVIIEHTEAVSQQANEFEAGLIEELVRAALSCPGLDHPGGIGIVVPHRAQKALLRARLPDLADSIDTVERFQGGERDLIIVSATVSDREFARIESGFLLDPRRLTVAISRPKRKLIVISSSAVFDLIPADLDEYERAALWKYLRHECRGEPLWEGERDGHRIAVRAMGVEYTLL